MYKYILYTGYEEARQAVADYTSTHDAPVTSKVNTHLNICLYYTIIVFVSKRSIFTVDKCMFRNNKS